MRAQDFVSTDIPNVLRDRLLSQRLHPRMPMHEVIEEAVDFWESCGGWIPYPPAPVDGYEFPRMRGPAAEWTRPVARLPRSAADRLAGRLRDQRRRGGRDTTRAPGFPSPTRRPSG